LHDFDLTSTEVSGSNLEMLSESLHVNGGVVSGNHKISLFLLLFVLKEQVLREDSLCMSALELHFLEHLWDGEDWLVSDGGKADAVGCEILLS
jgi:hypothetical protein